MADNEKKRKRGHSDSTRTAKATKRNNPYSYLKYLSDWDEKKDWKFNKVCFF